MEFYPNRAAVYARALRELSEMARKATSVALYAVEYEAAIVNTALIFEVPVGLVLADIEAGRRVQVAA